MPFSDNEIGAAVREFWTVRSTGTQSARHDKAFLKLIADELQSLGWPAHIAQSARDKDAVVAGHFRVAKSWDIVCRDAVVGFVFVVCDEQASRSVTPTRVAEPDPAFENSSHIDRRRVFSQRIVQYKLNGQSLYDAAALLLVRRGGTFEHPDNPGLRP